MAACDLLIVGSGPAAWSCALTARQRGLSVLVAAADNKSLHVSLVYLNVLQETQQFLSAMRHQLRAAKKFAE